VRDHEFKPYTDFPELCVAELDDGDTCNRTFSEHVLSAQSTQALLERYRGDDDDSDMALEELHRRALHCGDVAAREVLNDYDRGDPGFTPQTGSETRP
jgi:hypothetical protein